MQTAGGEVAAGVPCQRGVRPAAGAKSPRVSGSPPSRPGPGGVETERRGSRFTGRWQQARPRPAGRVSRCHTCVVPAPARCAASLAPHGGSPQRSHGGRARNRGGGAREGRSLEPPHLMRPWREPKTWVPAGPGRTACMWAAGPGVQLPSRHEKNYRKKSCPFFAVQDPVSRPCVGPCLTHVSENVPLSSSTESSGFKRKTE